MTDLPSSNDPQKRFQIGLELSGGVSAGAYSAGVFDFLIQALDAWEEAKKDNVADVPRHQVGLKLFSGASAGAIAAMLGAIGLAKKLEPEFFKLPASRKQIYKFWVRTTYESWVTWPRLNAPDQPDPDIKAMGLPTAFQDIDFLREDDIISGSGPARPPISLLNCKVLDFIAGRALRPFAEFNDKRAYIPENLHIYVTTSNLRGIPYTVKETGGYYYMREHADRKHYVLPNLGLWKTDSAFYSSDPSLPVSLDALIGQPSISPVWPQETWPPTPGQALFPWHVYSQCALASAAFPIGLAPRPLAAARSEYIDRRFPDPERDSKSPPPDFPDDGDNADYVAADGGIIDNDPFEYIEAALRDADCVNDQRDPQHADRAILMVAPFPQPQPYLRSGAQKTDLLSIAAALFPAVKDQARFKPSVLEEIADPAIADRYQIAPERTPPGALVQDKYALASALLNGFGGFVDRRFRDHDFQLGRRNCQKFLQNSFVLSAVNPIFGLANADPTQSLPIIPLVGHAAPEVPYPEWPAIDQSQVDALINRIGGRYNTLGRGLSRLLGTTWLWRLLILLAGATFKPQVIKKTRLTVLAGLTQLDLLTEARLPADFVNAGVAHQVLAQLVGSSSPFNTMADLTRGTELSQSEVADILEQFQKAPKGKFWRVETDTPSDSDSVRYVLEWRNPGIIASLFL